MTLFTITLNVRDCKSGPYRECQGSQNILYAWAKDAPPKFLPQGEVYMYLSNEKCFSYMHALSLLQKAPLVNVTLCSPQFCQACSCIFFQSLLHFKSVSPFLEGLL